MNMAKPPGSLYNGSSVTIPASTDEPHALILPGQVAIRAPSRSELEAVAKVFNTAELLEIILAFLAPVDLLLRAQLVCRGFQRCVSTSPSLRRSMFIDADSTARLTVFPYKLHNVASLSRCRRANRIWNCVFDDGLGDDQIAYYSRNDLPSQVSRKAAFRFCLTRERLLHLATIPSLGALQTFQPPAQSIKATMLCDTDFGCDCIGGSDVLDLKGAGSIGGLLRSAAEAVTRRFAGCQCWRGGLRGAVCCKLEVEGVWEVSA